MLLQTDSGVAALEISGFRVEHPPIEAEFPATHARSAPDQSAKLDTHLGDCHVSLRNDDHDTRPESRQSAGQRCSLLKDAAETVCASQHGRDLGGQMRSKMCWQSALGAAVSKVDRPALTTYRAPFKGRNATFRSLRTKSSSLLDAQGRLTQGANCRKWESPPAAQAQSSATKPRVLGAR
jgi:hypothetical protein